MQTDRWLIKDIQYVHELTSNLCGEAYALALSARQACRGAVQGEVVESHIQQERHSLSEFLQYLPGYLLCLVIHVACHLVHPCAEVTYVHLCNFRDVLVPDAVGQCFSVQAVAVALRAGACRHELVCPLLPGNRVVVVHYGSEVLHHTVERHKVVRRCMYHFFGYAHILQGSVHNLIHNLLRQLLYWGLYVKVMVLQDGIYLPEYHLVLVFSQWYDTAFVYAQVVVGNDLLQIYVVDVSQSLAMRAGTLGRVEREDVRGWVFV